MTKKTLGKNPLLAKIEEDDEPIITAEEAEEIRRASSDVDDFTTMSFKVRKQYLKVLRDYAYTNRLEIKEALDEALKSFIAGMDTTTLLEYPEKPKKTRNRGV